MTYGGKIFYLSEKRVSEGKKNFARGEGERGSCLGAGRRKILENWK